MEHGFIARNLSQWKGRNYWEGIARGLALRKNGISGNFNGGEYQIRRFTLEIRDRLSIVKAQDNGNAEECHQSSDVPGQLQFKSFNNFLEIISERLELNK